MKVTAEKRNILLLLAFWATTLLTLVPLFHVGFTTGDDFEYYNTASKSFSEQWHLAKEYSRYAGRFYFLFTKFFYYVPYLVDSFVFTKAVQYVSLVLCYVLFAYVVFRLFKSKTLALITYLFLVLDTVVTSNNFIPTFAYPFFFSFSLIIFNTGILLYINYIEKGGYWRVLLSALLIFASYMFYENYLLFAFVFVLIIALKHFSDKGFWSSFKTMEFWKATLPYVAVTAFYLFCYFGYRHWFVDPNLSDECYYKGTQFSFENFSVTGFFKVLISCTVASFPWQAYIDNQGLLAEYSSHQNNLLYVLTHAPLLVWVNALLQAVLLWFVTRTNDSKSISLKKIVGAIAICVAIAFFSHTLIGIGEKYNLEWSGWMQGYVTTFYAIFTMMLAFALLLVLTLKFCKNSKMGMAIRLLWCVALIVISVVSGYTSHILSRGWENSQNQLKVVETMAKDGYLKDLPSEAVVFTGEMRNMSYFSNEICKETTNLEQYIDSKAGRQFKYENNLEAFNSTDSSASRYYIHSVEDKKGGSVLLALSRIDSTVYAEEKLFVSSRADVFCFSPKTPTNVRYYDAVDGWKTAECNFEKTSTPQVYHMVIEDLAINPGTIVADCK